MHEEDAMVAAVLELRRILRDRGLIAPERIRGLGDDIRVALRRIPILRVDLLPQRLAPQRAQSLASLVAAQALRQRSGQRRWRRRITRPVLGRILLRETAPRQVRPRVKPRLGPHRWGEQRLVDDLIPRRQQLVIPVVLEALGVPLLHPPDAPPS